MGTEIFNAAGTGRYPTVFMDANPLADRHLTGIGRYTARLTLALRASGVPLRFFSNGSELLLSEGTDWSQDQDLGPWARRLWGSKRRPLENVPADSMGVYCCLRPKERIFPFEVSVLHDFTPQTVPHTHSERTRGMFRGFYGETLLSSDAALAVSESTRADAAWLTDFDPERVTVAHSGPTICLERHLDGKRVERRPEVGLVVSTIEPRKNAFFLLEWFRSTKVLPPESELWWVGSVGWLTSKRQLREYQRVAGRKIRFLGVVPDERLCALYRTAGWSVYPSLYEGFGFPVLDALRHGAPVLTSLNSSLREFDVPGVHFFDPCRPESLDACWQGFEGARGMEIPLAELERRYAWGNVARALIGLRGGGQAAAAARDASRAA